LETVTVSAKYQVVIPRAIRRSLGIQPGQKMQVFLYDNRVEFVPVKRMRQMRGFLKGIDTTLERDADRV
jgi:AbrB family looped-hinge helix DNA binding protein